MYSSISSRYHNPLHLHLGKFGDVVLNEDAALYLSHTLRFLAISLVGVFLPIYIYELSFSAPVFSETPILNGLSWVLAYFGLRSLGVLTAIFLLLNVLFKVIHLQRSIILSFIILICEIVLWTLAESNVYLMLLAGFLAGIKVALYWIPYHIFFVRKVHSKKGHFGKSTGARVALVMLASGISPFVGGLIISTFGFQSLFFTSVLLLFFASIPIIFSVSESKHKSHDGKKLLNEYYFNPKYEKVSFAYLGEGIESLVNAVFWPILLFITLSSFVKLGILTSIAVLLSSIAMFTTGRLIDKRGTKYIHGLGIGIISILNLLRALTNIPVGLYLNDIFHRVAFSLYAVPNMSLSYEKAKKNAESDSDFLVYREIAVHVPMFLVSILLILVITSVGYWKWVFILAALTALLTYYLDVAKK